MDKIKFSEIMKKLEVAYKKNFTTEELKLWFEEFKNTELKEFEQAIDKTIKEIKYMPKVAEVRARVKVNPNDYYADDPYAYLYKNLEWCQIVK